MPDVFSGTWGTAVALADLRAAGITSHMLKVYGDTAYYHLGVSAEPKINIKSLSKPDALMRQRGFGFEADISVQSLQASSVEIGLLAKMIVKQPVSVKLQSMDSIALATTSLFGLQWKLINDAASDLRRIEYMYKGFIKSSEIDALTTTSPPSSGTPDAGDTLYTLAQTVVKGNECPAGLTKIEFKAAADSLYADAGDFGDAKYTFECIGEPGGGGRNLPRTSAIKFTFDVSLNQTTKTQLYLLDAILGNEIDLKLTHVDGLVLSMPNTNFSLLPEIDFSGDASKLRKIKLHAEGVLVPNGTTFVTTGGTTWSGLWS